jgi:hypothetical protein
MKYRDHFPATDQTRPSMRMAYIDTKALYEKTYGSPDPEIWTAVEDTCGDSYSGFIPSQECSKS